MFPSELVLETQRKEMRQAAENHRLAQFVQEGTPSLVQRLFKRLSAQQAPVEEVRESIKRQTKPTEAIA